MHKLAAALALSTALVGTPALTAELQVVASFSILGDMVEAIGGDRVDVTPIVGPDTDSHVYEPKPADAALLSRAGLVVINGLGLEGWAERLIDASGYAGDIVVATAGIAAHAFDEDDDHDHEDDDDHHDDEHHDDGHAGHDHGPLDPHAWQDLANGVIYAGNIRDGLCAADAEGCLTYTANAQAYVAQLMALDAEVRSGIAAIPEARRKVITSHDAFGYFGDAYGVAFLAPEGVSTESAPSAAAVARLIRQIREEGVTALFLENMSDARLISQIASETGVATGGTLYADALSAADGPAPTYIEMFRHNARLLTAGMAGE